MPHPGSQARKRQREIGAQVWLVVRPSLPTTSCPGTQRSSGNERGEGFGSALDPAGWMGLHLSENRGTGHPAQVGTQLSPGQPLTKDLLSTCEEPDPLLGSVGEGGGVESASQMPPALQVSTQEHTH